LNVPSCILCFPALVREGRLVNIVLVFPGWESTRFCRAGNLKTSASLTLSLSSRLCREPLAELPLFRYTLPMYYYEQSMDFSGYHTTFNGAIARGYLKSTCNWSHVPKKRDTQAKTTGLYDTTSLHLFSDAQMKSFLCSRLCDRLSFRAALFSLRLAVLSGWLSSEE